MFFKSFNKKDNRLPIVWNLRYGFETEYIHNEAHTTMNHQYVHWMKAIIVEINSK